MARHRQRLWQRSGRAIDGISGSGEDRPRTEPLPRSGRDEDGKLRFASVIVILAIVNVTAFTVTMTVTHWMTDSVPGELIISFFGFWGAEVIALALKRIFTDKKEENTDDI